MNKCIAVIPALLLVLITTVHANAESFIGGTSGLAMYPDIVTANTNTTTNAVAAANPGISIQGRGTQNRFSAGLKVFWWWMAE